MVEELIFKAEEQATARAEAEAYKLTESIKPELQKRAYDMYSKLMELGVRIMTEEILNEDERARK